MTRPRVAVLDDYQEVARDLADWASLDAEVRFLTDRLPDEDAAAAELADADVLVLMRERTPLRASLLARLPALRLVVTSAMRNASIDLAACRERGVTVCGTRSGAEPPAELTWALILGLAKHLTVEAGALRAGGPWQQTIGTDLHGATLGLVGLGRIGSQVARVGRAFGMDVVAWSPHLTDERAAAADVRRTAELDSMMAEADFCSLHLVLAESTREVVGAPELAAMKRSAYLVNTARSGLVDTEALVGALAAGTIAGAGLDVYDEEPLPPHHPFRTLPNVLGTPHLGYVSAANYRSYFTEAVEDIAAWQAGSPVRELG
jgi:phosphoglycerate dehydrogenase-like enzyme